MSDDVDEDEVREYLYVTDRDIFELLMSHRQRLTNSVVLELIRDRRTLVSKSRTRESLADYLSALPHDHNDLASLMDRSLPSARLEKSTFVELPADITISEIKAAIGKFEEGLPKGDRVNISSSGKSVLTAVVGYDELDLSKTRLAQRQRKHAQIDVTIEKDATVIRLPANERAKLIVEEISKQVALVRGSDVPQKELTLQELSLPEQRTSFFTTLISSVPGYQLQNATNVRVSIFSASASDEEFDDDDVGDVNEQVLAVVNKVALGGDNITATEQFKQLSKDGFFVVGITWRSIQTEEPGDLVKFTVSFEDPVGGKGIRYVVRHAAKLGPDHFATSFKRLPQMREAALLRTLERTTVTALEQVKEAAATSGAAK